MADDEPQRACPIRVGCAGWAFPKEHADRFPAGGTHLARYAGRLPAVEINSSFYRSHRAATYTRWAGSVPEGFRFAVKVPREVTHYRRLVDAGDVLDRFLPEATSLGEKLGPVLVQLPPGLLFSAPVAETFFAALRGRFGGDIVFEPRHPSWLEPTAERLVRTFRIARVAADPTAVAEGSESGATAGLVYYRLPGSPQAHDSDDDDEYLAAVAKTLSRVARSTAVWCIFDNSAEGAATANALDLIGRVGEIGIPTTGRAVAGMSCA